MVQKIEDKRIMTLEEAEEMEEYVEKWFLFIYVEKIPTNPHKGKGYVAYSFDSEKEMHDNLIEVNKEFKNVSDAISWGRKALKGDEI